MSPHTYDNPAYIASCSFGKDSIATILLALEHGEPLDAAVFSEVMFDHRRGISGEIPEHIEWVYTTAIPRLAELGVKVDVVRRKIILRYSIRSFVAVRIRVCCAAGSSAASAAPTATSKSSLYIAITVASASGASYSMSVSRPTNRDASRGCRTKGISVKRVCSPSTAIQRRTPDANAKSTVCCRLSTEPRIGAVAGFALTAASRSSWICAAAIPNCGANCKGFRRSGISHPKASNTGRHSQKSNAEWTLTREPDDSSESKEVNC